MVEPIDPGQHGELDGFEVSPRPLGVNDLGLEETDDGFGEGVVVRISDAADRAFDPGFGEAFGVPDR